MEKVAESSARIESEGLEKGGLMRIPVHGGLPMIYGTVLPIGGTRDRGGRVIRQEIGGILEVHNGLCEVLLPH